jgi:C4-dicarboxylate-specific signal transduction histidine kinase
LPLAKSEEIGDEQKSYPAQLTNGATLILNEPAAPSDERKSDEWLTQLYRRAELFPALSSLQETLRPEEVSLRNDKPRALIADDEPDMLRFLKSQLEPHYNVVEATDGLQAGEKATQFLPEIILLDVMMPEKDGLQVCRELRAKTSTQNIPIILLTARADEETKLAALSAGASDFLSKPFSTTELHVRVKNLVDSHQLQRKVARQNQVLEATLDQLKDTEAQLVQTEKLAGLGRMSAGIIHEINNPLNYTKTGLHALKGKGKLLSDHEREDFDEIIQDIEEGVNRVRDIVSDLRTFTHPDTGEPGEVDLNKSIAAAVRFLSNQFKDIRLEQDIPPGLTVMGNGNKLTQVFVNMLQNSVDAVKDASAAGKEPVIAIKAWDESGRRFVRIRDNGEGIAPENLGKIFDPFFTTKDVGEGMGLGLSICYKIVSETGGRIHARSEVGQFTEFTLEFPDKCKSMITA